MAQADIAAERGAHLEDLAHSQGWDAVIADPVTIDASGSKLSVIEPNSEQLRSP